MKSEKIVSTFKEIESVGFNADKTKELVNNLKNDGLVVGIEDLSSYIRKQGLIVEEHIGRRRNFIKVSPRIFGVDLTTKRDEVNEFFKEHIQMGRISFIPEAYEKKLVNIESSVRVSKKRNTIGYDSKFMTIDSYREFMAFVEQKKKEYLGVRDEIVTNWETILERFKNILEISLNDLGALDKEMAFSSIITKLPTKEEYGNSFYMSVGAKAFPVTENLEMFETDIQEQIKEGLNEETIRTMYEIIGHTLNDAFENVSKLVKSYAKNRTIAVRTLGGVKASAKRIGQKNIFHNKKVEEIRVAIWDMMKLSPMYEEMTEEAEVIMYLIYGYAKELYIEDMIELKDSPLSEDELLQGYSFISKTDEEVDTSVS